MKKAFLVFFSLPALFISCKKSSTDASATASTKYMTLSTGSKWTYDVISNPGTAGSATVIDTVTVSATDTVVGSRTYRIAKHTVAINGSTSDYYNISGNDYYRYQNFPASSTKIENIYLKDNADVATTWTQTVNAVISGTTLPVTITNSIAAKGLSKTINGTTYTNVIDVKTDLSSTGLPAGSIISNIHSYYAPKVGLIEGDYSVQVALASINVNTQTLIRTAIIL